MAVVAVVAVLVVAQVKAEIPLAKSVSAAVAGVGVWPILCLQLKLWVRLHSQLPPQSGRR